MPATEKAQPLQHFFRVKGGLVGCLYEVGDCFGDEGAGAAGRVEDVLVERFGHHFLHDGPRQPVRGVVFPQLAPLIGRYHGLIEDGRYIVGSLLPVEPGYTTGQGPEQWQSAHLGGPREEVRLHDPLKTGLASEVAAKEQVRRVVLRQAA